MKIVGDVIFEESDRITLNMKIGFDTHDTNKATRITLIHILLAWTLDKIITNNIYIPELEGKLDELQKALEICSELGQGKLDWSQQLWSSEFIKPQ